MAKIEVVDILDENATYVEYEADVIPREGEYLIISNDPDGTFTLLEVVSCAHFIVDGRPSVVLVKATEVQPGKDSSKMPPGVRAGERE